MDGIERDNDSDLEAQIRVSKILSRGFVFSIVWLAGLGSFIALVSGLQALRLINRSDRRITGIGMAWWCIISGALGTVFIPIFILYRW